MRKRGNESPDTSDSDFDEELRADRLPRVQEIYNFLGKYESMPKRGNESPDTLYSDSEQQLRAERSLRVQEFYDFLGKYESRERKKKAAVHVVVNVDWMNILDEMLRDPASRFSALHGAMVRAFVGGYLRCDVCEQRCAASGIVTYDYAHPRYISLPPHRLAKYHCLACNDELQMRRCGSCGTTPMRNHSMIWCRYPQPVGGWVCGACAPGLNKDPCCSVCHCYSYNYDPEASDEDEDEDDDDDEDEDEDEDVSSDSYLHSENSDNNDGFNDIGYLPDGTAMCQICARKRQFTMCPAMDGEYCKNFILRDDDYDDTDLCAACHLEWESSFT